MREWPWGKELLRWLAYIGPVVLVMVWLNAHFMPRSEVAILQQQANETHASLAVQVSELRASNYALANQMNELSNQVAKLNGYLAGKQGFPYGVGNGH